MRKLDKKTNEETKKQMVETATKTLPVEPVETERYGLLLGATKGTVDYIKNLEMKLDGGDGKDLSIADRLKNIYSVLSRLDN